jgi:hypothetical protein
MYKWAVLTQQGGTYGLRKAEDIIIEHFLDVWQIQHIMTFFKLLLENAPRFERVEKVVQKLIELGAVEDQRKLISLMRSLQQGGFIIPEFSQAYWSMVEKEV